jgi:hypothetical protein
MHTHLRRLAMITALTFGATGLMITPAQAMPTAQDQDHQKETQHPEYYNSSYYRLGNKEGLEDHKHNVQRTTHNHNYKTDEDKAAHDYGYQQGWKGQNYREPQKEQSYSHPQ